jgi:hypothetical protein
LVTTDAETTVKRNKVFIGVERLVAGAMVEADVFMFIPGFL